MEDDGIVMGALSDEAVAVLICRSRAIPKTLVDRGLVLYE